MEPDILVLGDFVFDEWSTPEALSAGGRQSLKVTDLPGGGRVVDVWGAVDEPRQWQGIIRGNDALSQAQELDQLRIAGEELPYSNGIEARTVVIEEFAFRVKRGFIEYSIRCVTTDDSSGAGGSGFGVADVGGSVASDLGAAQDVISGTPDASAGAAISNPPLPPARPSTLGVLGVGAGDLSGGGTFA